MSQGGSCEYPTFSGRDCLRPATTESPGGQAWCGKPHLKGTVQDSNGRNGPCSCGSGSKFKHCCAFIQGEQRITTGETLKKSAGVATATKKIVWSVGYNVRRWVFGYERDSRWCGNIIYIGPFYISRRLREPRS